MTPAELKVRIDAALEAKPDVKLAPFSNENLGRPSCNCIIGIVLDESYPSSFRANAVLYGKAFRRDGCCLGNAMMGFDGKEPYEGAPEIARKMFELGKSYRSHPRCILTQQGGANG